VSGGRPIRISIISNGRRARADLLATGNAGDRVARQLSRAGKIVGTAFAVSSIARAGTAFVKIGAQYTTSLAKIKALATEQDLAAISIDQVAKRLEAQRAGFARYGFSVGDAANGVVELVKAGKTLPQAMDAINGTLVLARAGEMDVADATKLVSQTLNTFGLKASKAGDVANYLANAANISSADVTDLAEAFKFVSPVAAAAGIKVETVNALLAELSNKGIEASIAGTGLRKFFQSLQAPAGAGGKALKALGVEVFDAQGKARPFPKVLDELRVALKGVNEETRKKSLRSIFGLTGINAAQVILDGGSKGLREYTKGVVRAGAAEKLASAQTAGLMGTLIRLKADGVSAAQALYREFSPIADRALRPMAEWLERNQSSIDGQARVIASRALPTLKAWARVLGDGGKALRDAADDAKPFVSVLELCWKVSKQTADAIHAIPGPVKTLAVEAGIASLVLPRLAGGVSTVTTAVGFNIARLRQWRAELTYTETRAQNLSTLTGRLGAAAKTAAGIGGLVALTRSASETNDKLARLEKIAGGAAVGFSLAGPWGAVAGGTVGLLASLRSEFSDTGDAAKEAARKAAATQSWATAKVAVQDLTDALHGTVKAYNAVTAAAVQKGFRDEAGKIKPWVQQLLDAGVSMDTLTRATLGQKDAQAVLARAQGQVGTNLKARGDAVKVASKQLADYQAQAAAVQKAIADPSKAGGRTLTQLNAEQARLFELIRQGKQDVSAAKNEYKDYASVVGEGARELNALGLTVKQQNALERRRRGELGLTKKAYDALPTRVRTKVEAEGAPQSKTAVLDFIRTAKLTPKQVVSVVRATGVSVTKEDLKKVGVAVEKIPKNWFTRLGVIGGGKAVADSRAFGEQAGSNFGAGYVAGIRPWTGRAAQAAAAMAASAQAAAKHADMSRSPSRKMMKIGGFFGQGYAVGIERETPRAITAATAMASRSQDAVERHQPKGGSKSKLGKFFVKAFAAGIRDDAGKVLDAVDKLYDKLGKKRERAAKKIVKQFAGGATGLKAIAAKQDALQDGNFLAYLAKGSKLYQQMAQAGVTNLEHARDKLADAKQAWLDYFNTVKSGLVAFGDITQLGKNSAGNATGDGIVKQLAARAAATERYAALVEQLKAAHLNDTALQQIIDAGVDGGLQTAEAIVAGGPQIIASINQLQARISTAGDGLGTSMANKFKTAGIQAAQGMVDGLESQAAALERASIRIANAMVRAIKKRLGIKSPSRVFKQLGVYTMRGLDLGMDQRLAERAGVRTAVAMQKGFTSRGSLTPEFDAFMRDPASRLARQPAAWRITLSAAERDAILRGRDITIDAATAQVAGVRTPL